MTRVLRTAALLGAALLLASFAPVDPDTDRAGSSSDDAPTAARTSSQGADGPDRTIPRLAGPDRYATGVAIAEASQREREGQARPTAAVLARGDAFADALAGAPLAEHLDAPVLLTRPDGLPDVTRDALGRLLAPGATVHVLGGTTAVHPSVVATLESDGWAVRRHAGPDRYATAAAIASFLPASDLAYVASGVEPADALAAAPVAARQGAPVLLTDPAALPDATDGALDGVDRVVLVGGTAAVSDTVATALAEEHAVRRVAGPDRFATAVEIAGHAPGDPTAISLASGRSWPDALTGAAHAAATGSALLLADTDRLTWPTAAEVTRRQELPVRVYGGEAAVAAVVEHDVRLAWASNPGAPAPTAIEPGRAIEAGVDLRLRFSDQLGGGDLTVTPAPEESPTIDADTVTVPLPDPGDDVVAVTVEGHVRDAQGRVRHLREPVTVVPAPGHRRSPEGFWVAAGSGPVVGEHGPLRTWTVEVEPATDRPLDEVLPVVAAALEDTGRGWTARGEWRLQRIDDPTAADVRVVLATPDTVDAYCARHGLNTAGIYSCWDGQRAMLNLMRWDRGAADFDDIDRYRTYQVNHEVGHGLGYGHAGCPAEGAPAPVMMQQTKSVGACEPNGWPYP